ncbi:MAG: hypothetical protein JEZ07_18670 [Phycisphaerae bacterium]|nr:hypothetical protein [Phycisphaerae bacterium]
MGCQRFDSMALAIMSLHDSGLLQLLAYEYGRQGKDWETELNQRAKEKQLMTELGLEH